MATLEITEDKYTDSREIIERIEELEVIRQPGPVDEGLLDDEDMEADQDSLFAELAALEEIDSEGRSTWGEEWEYGITLIAESQFVEYAQEFARDMGALQNVEGQSWPMAHIDWDAAADELRQDYEPIEIDGITFLGR